MEASAVPKPRGVHDYLSQESFRNIELRRNYVSETCAVNDSNSIYQQLAEHVDWQSDIAWTRDFRHGGVVMSYDKKGKMRMTGHQKGSYQRGRIPMLDDAIDRIEREFKLDYIASVALNFYPDGKASGGSHRHDCWTALLSFGHERILAVDGVPLLMQNGDLFIFGTQRHGVPKMPQVQEGRISVAIFFWPTEDQVKDSFQTVKGDEKLAGEVDSSEGEEEEWYSDDEEEDEQPQQLSDDVIAFMLEAGIDLTDKSKSNFDGLDNDADAKEEIAAIQAQFAEYDRAYKADDYDHWDGRTGDLMSSGYARDILEDGATATSVDIFSLGVGQLKEREFLERLRKSGIKVVYDLRDRPPRDGPFCAYNLRGSLTANGGFYKHKPIGRMQAGGVLGHLKSDEGKHVLAEIVWQARRHRTCIVGPNDKWSEDVRAAAAHVLCQRGHKIFHIGDGCFEKDYIEHDPSAALPPWLQRQQTALQENRVLASSSGYQPDKTKAFQASSQSLVMNELKQQPEEIDPELWRATNQYELNRAMQRMEKQKNPTPAQVAKIEDEKPVQNVELAPTFSRQKRWGKKK